MEFLSVEQWNSSDLNVQGEYTFLYYLLKQVLEYDALTGKSQAKTDSCHQALIVWWHN